jgi:catechol 2,3-dioxygenase-like lactoylglutathione lyase family enzyme
MVAKVREIRQVAAIVDDLEPAVALLHDLFDIEPSVRQELTEFGLINAVLPIGDQFLELLQPIDEESSGWRYLQKRGPGFYMLIFESDEGLRAQTEADRVGIPVVWTADNDRFVSVHFHPRATAHTLVSVDTSKVVDGWPAAGPDWRDFVHTDVLTGIHVFRIAGPDIQAMKAPVEALFGFDCESRAPRGDTDVDRARVGHSGTYIDFVSPTSDAAHLATWLREHGPGPSGIEVQVKSLDEALARADTRGVGYRPRNADPSGAWQAVNLDAADMMGLPITLVESLSDENPWSRGA